MTRKAKRDINAENRAARPIPSFDEFCGIFRVTPAERVELAWYLAQRRARRTFEKLREAPIENGV